MKHVMFHYMLRVQLGVRVIRVFLTTVYKKRSALPTKVLPYYIGDINPGINSTMASIIGTNQVDVVCCYISLLRMYLHSEIRLHIYVQADSSNSFISLLLHLRFSM